MKNLLFFFLIATFAQAQTHRFIYELDYKKDSTENTITKENYYLDINSTESFFYARPYFVTDSIQKTTGEVIFNGKMTDIIQKNLKNKEFTTFIFTGFDGFKIKDNSIQKWEILPETKIENNLKLQKAQTFFGKRSWVAWFASEIPFQEGPYKFGNLPGLITEIFDDKGNYHFILVKSENLNNDYVLDFYKIISEKNIEIPYSKFKKMKLEEYESPLKAARNGNIDISKTTITTEYGNLISSQSELKDYEVAERNRLKKYNNPIELDKAIHYPQK